MVYAIVSLFTLDDVVCGVWSVTYLANGIGGHCDGAINSKGM